MSHDRRQRALVIGGGGMLSDCVEQLLAQGWHVVLPSKRYRPLGKCPKLDGSGGTARWVRADWSAPAALARDVARELDGPADLLVAWLPENHRVPVLRAVGGSLAGGAGVVEVYSCAELPGGLPEPALPEHVTQRVALGYIPLRRGRRHANHAETSAAITAAVTRALRDAPPEADQIGEPDIWPHLAQLRS
ncbi:hypothetical protein [Sciscionella sediminilitoris]|uniref:hypothetical protein n=1 Tax=Sciscionella sediminilitoris TaxID=1445613 RepID=UPI0007C6856E|nr:hypothetical protein [Sciscionella sp. SE31]